MGGYQGRGRNRIHCFSMLESGAASPFSILAGTLWNSNHRRKVLEICTNFKWWPRFGQAWNSHSCKQRRLKRKYYPQIWGIFYFQIQTILHISIKLVFTTLLSCISSLSHWQRRILAKVYQMTNRKWKQITAWKMLAVRGICRSQGSEGLRTELSFVG